MCVCLRVLGWDAPRPPRGSGAVMSSSNGGGSPSVRELSVSGTSSSCRPGAAGRVAAGPRVMDATGAAIYRDGQTGPEIGIGVEVEWRCKVCGNWCIGAELGVIGVATQDMSLISVAA